MSGVLAVDYGRGVSDAWASIARFVPKFVAFLVILLIAWIIAKALSKAVDVILERVGFDRVVERGGVAQALSRSKYDASDIVAKLVYYAVLLIGLSMAFGIFGNNPISGYLRAVIAYLPLVFVAIVLIVVTAFLAKAAKDFIGNTLGGLSYGNTIATIASVAIWFFGIIAALHELRVATTLTYPVEIAVLAALVGVAVVGVGGGLIRPMQARWERWLSQAESESSRMREQVRQRQASSTPYPEETTTAPAPSAGVSARGPESASGASTQVFPAPGGRDLGGGQPPL